MQRVPETGLTILFEPNDPSVDIVFVHGFTGHPERTWTSKKPNPRPFNDRSIANKSLEPPSKIRRLNPFSTPHRDGDIPRAAVYWPRDLVPSTVPFARVSTYGYDTHIRHRTGAPVNRNTVYDIAWNLLVALEAQRRTEPSRPVLFVVHSLGGIVIKEMLRRSRGCQLGQAYLRSVFESTIGMVFFGTPHTGADPRTFLHHIGEKLAKAVGFSVNEQIVNTLLPSSERLRELRDEFGPMAQERGWVIHSFQEQFGIDGLFGQKVVDDTSSYLNTSAVETTEHIGRNHMEMCRFWGFDDIEYKKVASALHRITSRALEQPTTTDRSPTNDEKKQELLDSLRFDQIDSRQSTIKNAHAKTCKWLLGKSEYLDWLDPGKFTEHHGFLWIKGKPGTGKSTLMKFALANARKNMKDKIIVSFFFNARGDDLEKSTAGMYRSLLLQILERLPDLQDVFDSLGSVTWNSGIHQWSIESLKSLLEQAVQSLESSSLVCFIDALDECDERQIRDMISFFESLGETTTSARIQFRVCFSSRHYPYITIAKGISLILERQDGHSQDIISYVNSELKIGHSKLAEEIGTKLQDKASGVFMWVVLVVEILNKEHDDGNIHSLRKRLEEIPGDLHALFRDILTRDHHHKGKLLLCIQWVLFARQPLKPEQLYFAILSDIEPEVLSEWDPDETTATVIQRFILNSSKGLSEITKSKSPTVQFIHESVKDFLLKENGFGEIWSDLGKDFAGESHERLKQCCLSQLCINITTPLGIPSSLPPESSKEAADLRQLANKRFPFLEYATQNVLYHADLAETGGVSQANFLQNFQLTNWIGFNNLFEKHAKRRYSPAASLLYLLAEHNAAALIRVHPSNQDCFSVEDERYGTPIFAALATASNKAVAAFVEVHSEIQPEIGLLHDLCKAFAESQHKCLRVGRNFTFSRKKGLLSVVLEQEDEGLLAFFIATGHSNVKDQNSRSPLSWAAQRGQVTIVKLLLDKGADIESKPSRGLTPLLLAVKNGHIAIVKLLLDKGADMESKSFIGQTPLSLAARNGNTNMVGLLLDKGADIESKSSTAQTPLSLAAENGHVAIVKLLLDRGADIDSKCCSGRSPLSWAAQQGHLAVVNLLLDRTLHPSTKGCGLRTPLLWAASGGHHDVVKRLLATENIEYDWKDDQGRTSLSWAAINGHEAVVKLLLATGRVDLNSRDEKAKSPLLWAATLVEMTTRRYTSQIHASHDLEIYATHDLEIHASQDLVLQDYQLQLMLLEHQNKRRLMMARLGTILDNPLLNTHGTGQEYATIIRLLLQNGADIELKDQDGQTSLLHVSRKGLETIVKLLLDNDADTEAKDKESWTPLLHAAQRGHEAVVKLLLDKDANVEAKDKTGRTPLSRAAESGHEAVVQQLLDKGADVKSKDEEGQTPLSFAAVRGREAIIRLLKSEK